MRGSSLTDVIRGIRIGARRTLLISRAPRCSTGVSSVLIPKQLFGRIQQVRQPRPQLTSGAPNFRLHWCSVSRSKRRTPGMVEAPRADSYRHRVRRSGRCQPNL
jgi:hypothetical protein